MLLLVSITVCCHSHHLGAQVVCQERVAVVFVACPPSLHCPNRNSNSPRRTIEHQRSTGPPLRLPGTLCLTALKLTNDNYFLGKSSGEPALATLTIG
jgi:hypothetical protein